MAYEVGALSKSIKVLECIAQSDDPLGVSEIVRRTRLAKNMVYRICQTLCEHGWLEAIEPGPVYRLTLTPFHIFSRALERLDLQELSHDEMKALQHKTGETVYLSVRNRDSVVNIGVREGSNPLRVAGSLGASFDLHCTAQGKVLLAYQDADLKVLTLKKYTDKTITTKKKLSVHLAEIREQGYAINNEEFGRGLLGCAAPIFDQHGHCIAAIGVFAASTNVSSDDLHQQFAPLIKTAAANISRRLGHQ